MYKILFNKKKESYSLLCILFLNIKLRLLRWKKFLKEKENSAFSTILELKQNQMQGATQTY